MTQDGVRRGRTARAETVPGRYFGHYEIVERLAVGGMAEVFLAKDAHTGERVVLKHGLAEMMGEHQLAGMFYDEARLVRAFDHPNIVKALDIRSARTEHYYVMEYLDGLDCSQLLIRAARAKRRIPLSVAVNLIIRLADALHYAHELYDEDGLHLRIVHRDISPGNVRLTLDGQVKLLDFGVASASMSNRSVTQIGQVKGKMTYMAPEQLACQYDRRSDVFSLGVVLYELTTLKRFFGTSKMDLESRLVFGEPTAPSERVPDYPDELEAIVMKAVATNPDERYQTAGDFGRALVEYVVSTGMRLSDELLREYVTKLVEQEGEPAIAKGTSPEDSCPELELVTKDAIDSTTQETRSLKTLEVPTRSTAEFEEMRTTVLDDPTAHSPDYTDSVVALKPRSKKAVARAPESVSTRHLVVTLMFAILAALVFASVLLSV